MKRSSYRARAKSESGQDVNRWAWPDAHADRCLHSLLPMPEADAILASFTIKPAGFTDVLAGKKV